MSERAATRLLWVVLLVAFPMPMLGLEGSTVPVARYAQLALALSGLAVLEGTQGMVGLFLALLWGHVLVYGALLYAAVVLLRRSARSLSSVDGAARVLVACALAVLVWAVALAEYDTQFHHATAHASWAELYR